MSGISVLDKLAQGVSGMKGRFAGNGGDKRLRSGLVYGLVWWVFDKAAEAYRVAVGGEALTKFVGAMAGIEDVFLKNPLPSLYPRDMAVGLVGTAAVWAVVTVKRHDGKKYRPGVEYGSARWSA